MNWAYIIGGGSLALGVLALMFKLVIDRKDATIQSQNTNIAWLQQRLKDAEDNSPDATAERLLKRITVLEKDIDILSQDKTINEQTILEKTNELNTTNEELQTLRGQIERANELLEEATYYKDEFSCPTCGAEVTTIAGEDVEFRVYACGSSNGPDRQYPCPYDPEFPKFEDYNLEVRKLPSGKFFCNPKPKNKNAYKLTLQPQAGATEEEAKQKIKTNFERLLPKKQVFNPSAG